MTHRYVLPWPPSLNRYYRSVNGRVLISREGRQYRADVQMRLLGSPTIRTRCKVEIHAWPPDRRKRDLDNIQKALLDSIQHGGAIEDDALIDDLHITREDVMPGGRVVVEVTPLETP